MEPQQENERAQPVEKSAGGPPTESPAGAPAADRNDAKTPDVTGTSPGSGPGAVGIPPEGSPPDGTKPGDPNGTSPLAGLKESITLFNSAIPHMLSIAIIAGIGVALIYYVPLHFFPLDGLSGASTVLAVFGTFGLLFVVLLELPYLFAVYGIRYLLTESKLTRVLDANGSATKGDIIGLLVAPPFVAAVLLGLLVGCIDKGWTRWPIAIYLALAGVGIWLGERGVRRCASHRIAREFSRMTGYGMILFLLVSLPWTLMGNGLQGVTLAWYLFAVSLAGGWMAGVWARKNNPGMRMASILLPIFVAMLFGGFLTNFVNAVVGDAGVRVSRTTLILSHTAYRDVLALGVGTCAKDASSAGCVAVCREFPGSTSKEYLARNVIILSKLGSRWLLGFPLDHMPAHPDCTPPRPGTKSPRQCMNLILRSQDILMEGTGEPTSSNRPQAAPKGATSPHHLACAAVPAHTH